MQEPLDHNPVDKDRHDFKFYRNFINQEEADTFVEFLKSNNIPYLAETTGTVIDKAIVGDGLVPKVIIKIPTSEFKKVNTLIANDLRDLDYSEVEDHYLNQLETSELTEILEKPDEWTAENIEVAKILLRHRGMEIKEEELEALAEKRFEEVRKGKAGSKLWMGIYLLGMVIGLFTNIVFIVAGIGMFYYYGYGKSVDPDGNKYFIYEESTRSIGKVLFFVGIGLVAAEILYVFVLNSR